MMTDDMELVREYVARQSETAFETLVSRHINLVYSSALRQVGDPHLAEEITQAVFIILSRKAGSLGLNTVLSAWLYRTTRYASADALKSQRRRQWREQEAHMQSKLLNEQTDPAWERLSPLLDEGMARLGEKDRSVLVLRFFENKTAREIAAVQRVDESAAQKRISRALDKLRSFFIKRGIALSAAAIAGAVSANSVQAAPIGLATAVVATAAKGSAAAASTLTLVKGALKIMAWTKAKTAIVSGAGILLALGLGTLLVQQNSDQLTASEILARTRDNYASLTNYTGSGTSFYTTFVAASPSEVIGTGTNGFALKLARPNFYRTEWEDAPPNRGKGAVWSAGDGYFFSGYRSDNDNAREHECFGFRNVHESLQSGQPQ